MCRFARALTPPAVSFAARTKMQASKQALARAIMTLACRSQPCAAPRDHGLPVPTRTRRRSVVHEKITVLRLSWSMSNYCCCNVEFHAITISAQPRWVLLAPRRASQPCRAMDVRWWLPVITRSDLAGSRYKSRACGEPAEPALTACGTALAGSM